MEEVAFFEDVGVVAAQGERDQKASGKGQNSSDSWMGHFVFKFRVLGAEC